MLFHIYRRLYKPFLTRHFLKPIRIKKLCTRLEFLCLMIGISFILNLLFLTRFVQYSLSLEESLVCNSKSKDFNSDIISTIERSRRALEKLKILLSNVTSSNDPPWIWIPTNEYPSVPYQPTSLLNNSIPKFLYNITILPQSVQNEVNRVCKRLLEANKTSGEIWCKLFNKSYTDTLVTTTTILDDNTTYIITGDIDLMWLRDSR